MPYSQPRIGKNTYLLVFHWDFTALVPILLLKMHWSTLCILIFSLEFVVGLKPGMIWAHEQGRHSA